MGMMGAEVVAAAVIELLGQKPGAKVPDMYPPLRARLGRALHRSHVYLAVDTLRTRGAILYDDDRDGWVLRQPSARTGAHPVRGGSAALGLR